MQQTRITIDPTVLGGKPCIAGTRVSVETILRWLAEGRTHEELLNAYPHLVEEDIRAALAYAAKAVRSAPSVAAE